MSSQLAGTKILPATTGDAQTGLEIVLPRLPRNAFVVYYFSPGRAEDVVLRHEADAADGLLIPANVGDPDDFQSGPWRASQAPRFVTASAAATITITPVLVSEV